MKNMGTMAFIALILIIVGGINWGFIGIFSIDVVSAIFGHWLSRLIYVVIGLSAVYLIYERFIKN